MLAPLLDSISLQISSKIEPEAKNVIFSKWAPRVGESSIWEGQGAQNPPKSDPEIDKKNDAILEWKKHRKW